MNQLGHSIFRIFLMTSALLWAGFKCQLECSSFSWSRRIFITVFVMLICLEHVCACTCF